MAFILQHGCTDGHRDGQDGRQGDRDCGYGKNQCKEQGLDDRVAAK